MIRLALHGLAGLILGGLVHVVIVLGVPFFAPRDAWTQIGELGPHFQMNTLPAAAPGQETLPLLDPALAHAVCRFDLDGGAVRIRARLPDTYWSVALFDRSGTNVYNLNDRAAEGRPIDMVIAGVEQVAQLRETPTAASVNAILIEWPTREGFALVRVFVPSASLAPDVDAALKGATCEALVVE